jgi:hypothetical protein
MVWDKKRRIELTVAIVLAWLFAAIFYLLPPDSALEPALDLFGHHLRWLGRLLLAVLILLFGGGLVYVLDRQVENRQSRKATKKAALSSKPSAPALRARRRITRPALWGAIGCVLAAILSSVWFSILKNGWIYAALTDSLAGLVAILLLRPQAIRPRASARTDHQTQ